MRVMKALLAAAVAMPCVIPAMVEPAVAEGTTYYACLAKGKLSAVGAVRPKKCKGEVISWNSQGSSGASGAQGAAGAQGAPGDPGPQGATGPQGPTGLTGSPGPTGPTGADGPKGVAGSPGPQGDRGPTGLVGPQGPPGQDATAAALACDTLAERTAGNDPDNALFLQIPGIPGESVVNGYEEAIDISSFCLGAADAADNGVFTVEKRVDAATPPLLTALQQGSALDEATVTVVQRSNSRIVGTYEFTGLHVTGYRFGGHDSDGEDVLFRWADAAYTVKSGTPQTLKAPLTWGIQSMPVCDAVTSARAANAGYDGFLKIEGVEGGSIVKGHEREIDIQALCFGATNIDGSSPSFTAFTMPKLSDVSTGPLFTAFGKSTALGKTSIALARRGANPTEFLKIGLPAASVEAMVIGGPSGASQNDLGLGWRGGSLTYTPAVGSPQAIEISR